MDPTKITLRRHETRKLIEAANAAATVLDDCATQVLADALIRANKTGSTVNIDAAASRQAKMRAIASEIRQWSARVQLEIDGQ